MLHRRARRRFLARLAFSVTATWAAVWLTHWPLLHLPYYWDEAGYYIPAAYDFFRTGSLIPYSTLSNAHPPLPSLYLAAAWRLFGFSPFVTRTSMCLVAAIALTGVYRVVQSVTRDARSAWTVTGLTALYPVWFVQSTLAHADLLAAAGTLWGLAFFFAADAHTGQPSPDLDPPRVSRSPVNCSLAASLCCFALAALAKEVAIGTPLALGAWEFWLASRRQITNRLPKPGASIDDQAHSELHKKGYLRASLLLAAPTLPLACWFAYHRWRTGFTFGNPEYLRYNATSTLTPLRVALALGHRALHLTAHLNLFVPVLITLGCLLLPRLHKSSGLRRSDRARIFVVLAANWIFFSILGGALLTRYLLPLYPLVLLLCVDAWRKRLRHWQGAAGLTAAAFVLGLFINPPYRFAPEDTLAYRDSILLEQDAILQIQSRYRSATVLTAWPATDALTKPELGYVSSPMPVVAIDNFSYPQIEIAQQKTGQELGGNQPYTVALLFSTKYEPSGLLDKLEGRWGERKRALDERYFGLHYDLSPAAIAQMLGGQIVWQEQRNGQWAAVLHLDRPQLALGGPPSSP